MKRWIFNITAVLSLLLLLATVGLWIYAINLRGQYIFYRQSEIVIRQDGIWFYQRVQSLGRQGQISTQAALNLKENVEVTVENCVFRDNDICFRLRGDTGERGGAMVTIRHCAIYKSKYGLRIEDRISNLKVYGLGFGKAVERKYRIVGKDVGPGYVNEGEITAPLYEQAVRRGLMIRSKP